MIQTNEDQFWDVIKQLDPDLYMIKLSLTETGIDPRILPEIVRSLCNLTYGSGYGKIQIFMENKTITQIKGEESIKIDRKALVDKSK